MKPLNLREYAESLRIQGNHFADEILRLCDWRDEVEPVYSRLIDDLEYYARGRDVPNDLEKQLEWLGDRSHLLDEIADMLDQSGRNRDVADEVRDLIDTVDILKALLIRKGHMEEGDDIYEAVAQLCDRLPAYDL